DEVRLADGLCPFDGDDAAAIAALFNPDLDGNALMHRLDMADDADLAALAMQPLQSIDGDVERVGIETAEALVDEQRVDEAHSPFETGQCQRQGERREEALAARQADRRATRLVLLEIDDLQA